MAATEGGDAIARLAAVVPLARVADPSGPWARALVALVHALDPRCRPERLLAALPQDGRPLDEVAVLNTLAHLSFVGRPIAEDVAALDERLLPAFVVPVRGDPFLVLPRDGEGRLRFFHSGPGIVSTEVPGNAGAGRILLFTRHDASLEATSRFMRGATGARWFAALLGRFRREFVQIAAAGLALNVLSLAPPLFMMVMYDRVIGSADMAALPMLGVGAVLLVGFEATLRRVRAEGLAWFAARLDTVVSNRIFAQLVGLPPHLIERASVASQVARMKTFEGVRDFVSGSAFLSVIDAPFMFVSVLGVLLLAGPLVLVPLLSVGAYLGLFVLVRRRMKGLMRVAARASSARQQFTIDTFDKLPAIRSQGLSARWAAKFRQLTGRDVMAQRRLARLGTLAETLAQALTTLSVMATVTLGVTMIWSGALTAGALVAATLLTWRILNPFYFLCTIVGRLEQVRNAVQQIDDLMELTTEAEAAKSAAHLPRLRGAVAFHNVAYRHGGDGDTIFRGLTFSAAPGAIVALTGGNGTGKGEVLRIVHAMGVPYEGVVRIDGFDIRQLDQPWLRREIAYVPRRPEFFRGTIAENLRLAAPLASEAAVREALRRAAADRDVDRLPDGIHTAIGPHGAARPSLDLAARLSLARAYLHPGRIMLIDELPNAVLTGPAGANLKTLLAESRGERTVLICTFREDVMALADVVVLLRGEEPPLVGTHAEVAPALLPFGAAA